MSSIQENHISSYQNQIGTLFFCRLYRKWSICLYIQNNVYIFSDFCKFTGSYKHRILYTIYMEKMNFCKFTSLYNQ